MTVGYRAIFCALSAARGAAALDAEAVAQLGWWSPQLALADLEKPVSKDFDVDTSAASVLPAAPSRSLRDRHRGFQIAPDGDGTNLMQVGETTEKKTQVRIASMRGRAAVNNTASASDAHVGALDGAVNGSSAAAVVVNGAVNGSAVQAEAVIVNGSTASVSAVAVNASQATNSSAAGEKQVPAPPTTIMGWLRMTFSFTIVVKTLCMLSNILFQASPLPQVKKFHDDNDTGDTDSAPFVSIAYGSSQWCFYGMFAYLVTSKSGFLVLVYSNVVGACLGMMYVVTFTKNCRNEKVQAMSNRYFQVLGTVIIFQLSCMALLPSVRALFISGLISSAWSIVGSLSLLTTAPQVMKTKCSKSMPLPLLVCAFMSAIIWIVCGVMLHDPWITVPNVCSLLTCVFALSLVWIYPQDKPADDIEGEDSESSPFASEQGQASSVESSPRTPIGRRYGSVQASHRRTTSSAACSMGGTGETY